MSATKTRVKTKSETVPVISLPPDELVPHAVYRVEAESPDWGVLALKVDKAKNKGKGVKVAVLDTGVDPNHPDLDGRIKSADDLKDFSGSRYGVTDRQGHGTHCAGRVLAEGTNYGVAPEADLIVAKVLSDSGSGGVDDIADGVDWAVSRGADVLSLSLGGPSKDNYIPYAFQRAEAAGVIIVCAMGNEGPREGTGGYPGKYPESVSVAAVDENMVVARFSSRDPAVYVSAPGVNIRSTYPGGKYATMSGTSMACPHVAGLAALWVAANPQVPKKERPAAFRAALKAACRDLASPGRDTGTGWGFPDAEVLSTGKGTAPPPPPPPEKDTVLVLADLGSVVDALKRKGYTVTK